MLQYVRILPKQMLLEVQDIWSTHIAWVVHVCVAGEPLVEKNSYAGEELYQQLSVGRKMIGGNIG